MSNMTDKINSSSNSVLDNPKSDIYNDNTYEKKQLDTTIDPTTAPREDTAYLRFLRAIYFPVTFQNKQHMVIYMGFFAAFAGILSGLDQSIISGATVGMVPALNLTSNEQSLVSSLMPLGAVAGSIMMTPLNQFFGRKISILISCIWYTIGAGLCAGSHSYHMLYAGRFLLGIGIGIEGGCVGIYIAECVPPKQRGNLVSLYQFNIAFGEVLGFAVAAIFYEVHGGWRYMLGSSLVFSTILFFGILTLPESPRYLAKRGYIGEAWYVWNVLRDVEKDEDAKLEFAEVQQAVHIEENDGLNTLKELLLVPRNRRALVYSIIMISGGQLVGINAIMYGMSTINHAIGFDVKKSVFMSLVGGGALFLGSIPAILTMDKYGRRTWGMNIIGFFIGLVLVGAGYRIDPVADKPTALGLFLTGIILYMGFYGSYACLTWVIPAESFSLATRSLGMTITSAFLYLFAFVVTYNFTRMHEAFTFTGLMLGFYGGITAIMFVYQVLFMPETKGKTLEEIDDIFNMSSAELAKTNLRSFKKSLGLSQ